MKKLTRSTDKIVAGVLAGFAEYFELDPTLVRLGYVLLAIFCAGFPAIIFYLVAWIIIPAKNGEVIIKEKHDFQKRESADTVSRETDSNLS